MTRAAAPLLVLLLFAGSAAAEETIWLRGRGEDVWIERDGEEREPRDAYKSVTIVSSPAPPSSDCGERRGWRGPGGGPLLPSVGAFVDLGGGPPDFIDPYGYGYGYMGPYPYPYWLDDGRFRDRRQIRHLGGHGHRGHGFGRHEGNRPELHRAGHSGGGHRHGGRGGDRHGR